MRSKNREELIQRARAILAERKNSAADKKVEYASARKERLTSFRSVINAALKRWGRRNRQ